MEVNAEFFIDLSTGAGVQVVERWQAVHEAALYTCGVHQLLRHPVRQQIADALLPDRVRLTHGDPDVGVKDVRALHSRQRVGGSGADQQMGHLLKSGTIYSRALSG